MDLKGERLIPASLDRTWEALNDPETLKACIPGCESVTRTGDNAFESVVAVKIGPVNARFKGRLQMTNVEAPRSYTINFDGQGGAAGFGKGSADVKLEPEGDNTRLRFEAKAQVGGKLAQLGSRLIDSTAKKLADEFFASLAARAAPADAVAAAIETPASEAGAPPGKTPIGWWIAAAVVIVLVVYYMAR